MQWFMTVLQKWSDFSSRARRREYWFFVLFYVLILIALTFVDTLAGLGSAAMGGVGVLTCLFWLAMLIPSLAVGVRRLHDTDRSGWWLLIAFIPLIGAIVLIVFYLLDSQPGDNRFGPNPKAAV